MGFFSRHRKAFKSVIASFSMLFGLLAGCASNPIVEQEKEPENVQVMPIGNGTLELGFAGLTTSYSGDTNFNYDSTKKTISARAKCRAIDPEQKATLEFKNNSGQKAILGFRTYCSKIEGSATAWGASLSQGSYWEKTAAIGAGETVSVTIVASWKAFSTRVTEIEISNIDFSVVNEYTTNFVLPNSPGSFEVDGQTISQNQSFTRYSDEPYTIRFTPSNGYVFVGWRVDGVLKTNDNPFTFYASKNGENVTPRVVDGTIAMFSSCGLTFSDLNEAIAKAKTGSDKTIVAVKDGTVASGNYTLDPGLSLLIPNEDNAALSDYAKKEPSYTKSYQSCTKYRKITFEDGTQLTTYGQIVVCSKPFFTSGSFTGTPSGGYGQIVLNQGSSIVLETGSNLYAWGFVTGDGEVWAKNGSVVYEMFQMAAWRGGGTTLKMLKNGEKVFVMNQYYVQNIEATLRMDAGAVENTLTGADISGLGLQNPCFPFIGNGGMFLLTSGYLLKKYDPNTDRLEIRIYGNGTLSSISFKISSIYKLNSADYVLPINNNITIEIVEGACKTEQDLGFLPGSELIIHEGASFEVLSGHNMTFYDGDTWGNYAYGAAFHSVQYSPTKKKSRTNADLIDAKLALDGTLVVDSESYLMTTGAEDATTTGARIISPNRTGVVKLTDADATTCPKVYQYESDYVAIPHTFAKLQNGDHSYTQSAPGNTYTYDKVLDRWNLSANPPFKTGLFKTLDGNTIQTVLLHDDVKQSNYTSLFYYSKETSASYNTADNHYYYLNKGVVSKRNEWWKDTASGTYYHFGPNQYAYQNMSVVLTSIASGDNPARGIKARHFFDADAKLLRMVSVDSITSNFSSGMTVTNDICYYNGIKAGFGLFENQSHVYLAKDDGSLMKDGTYYVPSHKINSIKDSSGKVLTAGLYYFDANGRMYDSNYKMITRGNAS